MSEDSMLKCLIAFILGWLMGRYLFGDGFTIPNCKKGHHKSIAGIYKSYPPGKNWLITQNENDCNISIYDLPGGDLPGGDLTKDYLNKRKNVVTAQINRANPPLLYTTPMRHEIFGGTAETNTETSNIKWHDNTQMIFNRLLSEGENKLLKPKDPIEVITKGCMDPFSINYNSEANQDDGECSCNSNCSKCINDNSLEICMSYGINCTGCK